MSKEKPRILAVIPAAGCGSRMKAGTNKQFMELCGIPMIIHTLRAFEKSPLVSGIYVAAAEGETETLYDLCTQYKISKLSGVVPGGATRQESVRKILEKIAQEYSPDKLIDRHVLIHDGARPFVTEDIIKRCVEGSVEHRACAAGVPVKDTLKQISGDGKILKTIPREDCRGIQTPQAFLFRLIFELHKKAKSDGVCFTDDTALCEFYGKESFIVEGGYSNIKITTPEDLIYGESIIKSRLLL